jgi:hypothetical protein
MTISADSYQNGTLLTGNQASGQIKQANTNTRINALVGFGSEYGAKEASQALANLDAGVGVSGGGGTTGPTGVVASFQEVTTSGSVPAGAYSIGFWLKTGTCSINGTSLVVNQFTNFEVVGTATYGAVNYVLGSSSILQITQIR